MEETRFLEINAEKRTIAVPSDLLLGVLGDKDAERVYFRCPKIVGDNINLAEHQIYVKYVTAPDNSGERYDKKDPGIYHCQDVIDEGEYITFSWKLSGNVFEKEGFIAFSVLAADGEVTRWNTFPAIGTVLITIPGGLEEVAEKYPDIITQLLNRMDEVEEIATPEAMQRYVDTYLAEHPVELDETLTDNTKAAPADVVGELKEETNHALQQSKATAIISTIKGEVLSTRSSAAIPPRNLKLFGKSWQDGEPSIDNPQEIQSLGSGGNIGGKVLSGNVFDSSYRNANDVIWGSGCEIEENNGVFTLICTKTDMFVWNVLNTGVNYKDNITVCKLMDIPSGVSKISVKLSNTGFNKNYITFYDENEITTKAMFHTSNVFTQTVPNGAKHYTIRFGKGDAVVGETYETTVMVEVI